MNIEKINEINSKYGALLEDLGFMLSFGLPERLLPFPKAEIEEGLIEQAKILKQQGNEKMLSVTIACYAFLSSFLPYEKYNIIKEGYEKHNLLKAMQDETFKKKAMIIMNDIADEYKHRVEKINKALGI